jgi:hypothetical protein
VKVVTPTCLLAEAADVLAPIRDVVVFVGAAALEVALADAASVVITPTRDVVDTRLGGIRREASSTDGRSPQQAPMTR